MIDERINQTLSELEKNLKNVDSARKQVEETVNSYECLKTTTATYVDSLSAVKEKLTELVNLVGKDYDSKVKDFEKDRNKIVDSCNTVLEKIDKTTDDIKDAVLKNIGEIHKKLVYILAFNVIIFMTMLILLFLQNIHAVL